jgi:hypothetical protein
MQTRALGSRVAWQNQVPVLDDSQTLVSRDGQGGSENREAWGRAGTQCRGRFSRDGASTGGGLVRVLLTMGNLDRMHPQSSWSALSGLTPRAVVV